MAFICRNGPEHRHDTVEQGRLCWDGKLYSNGQWSPDPVTATSPVDASAAPGVTPPPTPPPAAVPYAMQPGTSVPLPMLEATPNGYYAVRLDENDPYHFLRINRPQPRKGVRTKWVGCIVVQSQHSDNLKHILMYAPLDARPLDKSEWLWVFRPDWEKYIILAMVDVLGAGRAYAKELKQCCICGRALTDERSRHYGIGPECEKGHPDIIEYVDGLDEENK